MHAGSKTRLEIQINGGDSVYQNTCSACTQPFVLSPVGGKMGQVKRAVKATEQRT